MLIGTPQKKYVVPPPLMRVWYGCEGGQKKGMGSSPRAYQNLNKGALDTAPLHVNKEGIHYIPTHSQNVKKNAPRCKSIVGQTDERSLPKEKTPVYMIHSWCFLVRNDMFQGPDAKK